MDMKVTFEMGNKKAIFEIDLTKLEAMLSDLSPKETDDQAEPRSMETEGLGPEDYIKTFYGTAKGALPKEIRLDDQDVNFRADRQAIKDSGLYRYISQNKVWKLKSS